MSTLDEVLGRFRRFGPEQAAGPYGSPLYEVLCEGLGHDPAVARLLLEAHPAHQIPNLLLASVHDLLLAPPLGPSADLARFYPSVVGEAALAPDASTYATFHDFCLAHIEELLVRIRDRRTQTNEPGRAMALAPALAALAAEGRRRLAVLEAGASAGLLLLADRFRYDIDADQSGDPGSPVHLTARFPGPLLPPRPEPLPIGWRAGLDLAPVDVRDPVQRRWLAALLWPEHRERAATLRAALGIAIADPPRVVAGEMVAGIPRLAAEAPPDHDLVVMHATSAVYLSGPERPRLLQAVAVAAADRGVPVALLSFEAPEVIAEMGARSIGHLPAERPPGAHCALVVWHIDPDGEWSDQLVALAHPHGRWIVWLDERTGRRPATRA